MQIPNYLKVKIRLFFKQQSKIVPFKGENNLRKTYEQINDITDSFLAIDDVEVGHGNKIPLWMFGLPY